MSGKGVITLDIPVNEARLIIKTTSQLENNNIIPKGTNQMINHKMVYEQEGGIVNIISRSAFAGVSMGKWFIKTISKKSLSNFDFKNYYGNNARFGGV